MHQADIHRRFIRLPRRKVFGVEFPVAEGVPARLMGLAFIDPEAAGPGLLIPRCRSIHTFGMRFPIDVVFLDRRDGPVAVRHRVRPGRVVGERRATAVLESFRALDLGSLPGEPTSGGRETVRRD